MPVSLTEMAIDMGPGWSNANHGIVWPDAGIVFLLMAQKQARDNGPYRWDGERWCRA